MGWMLAWILAGAVVGAGLLEGPGLALGAVVGGLIGALRRTQARVETLQADQATLRSELAQLGDRIAGLGTRPPESAVPEAPAASGDASERAPTRGDTLPPRVPVDTPLAEAVSPSSPTNPSSPSSPSSPPAQARQPVIVAPSAHVSASTLDTTGGTPWAATVFGAPLRWLFGGNTVVRVGIVVLLVGLTLLLKYAAESALFPLEARLGMAAAIGLGLVAVGVRQRRKRPGFAMTLQGGGIAATYLVVFFAYRSYGLLPPGLAFGLLATLAVASALLALAQDAMVLVLIGQIGGFMAPILASSNTGNHVALFSYYLLLNLAVFGIALRRAYRPLNLTGFIFTFGIGTFWGVLEYEPAQLASTEPFLVAFFLLYVAIAVLYALRHQTRGWLDSSLLFGAPLAFLGLQTALVSDIPFAMAYTTLGVAILYAGLAYWLRRRDAEAFRGMSDAFIVLAVGFATLSVPYGLDNAGLTGATWALEGAGAYWVGVRQVRRLPRAAGVLLQLLAGGALIIHAIDDHSERLLLANTQMLGAVLLAAAGLFIAHLAQRASANRSRRERRLLQLLIPWSLCVLFGFGMAEIDANVAYDYQAAAALGLVGFLGTGCAVLARRLAWPAMRYPVALQQLFWLPIALLWRDDVNPVLLAQGGAFAWPLWFASMALTLQWQDAPAPVRPSWLNLLHPLALWNCLAWLSVLWLGLLPHALGLGAAWAWAAVLLTAAVGLYATVRGVLGNRRPFAACPSLYLGLGAGGTTAGAALALWHVNLSVPGDTAPLAYLPVLNPLDIAQLLLLAAMVAWARGARGRELSGWPSELLPAVFPAVAGLAFVWWNGMLARTVHHYADVPFGRALWDASPFQVALSVSWTGIGLLVTVYASRQQRRTLWFAGAALLGIVVLKLFALDLGQLSAVAKIGTFLVVGLLLLAVGFLAPMPPAPEQDGDNPPDDKPSPSEPPNSPQTEREPL